MAKTTCATLTEMYAAGKPSCFGLDFQGGKILERKVCWRYPRKKQVDISGVSFSRPKPWSSSSSSFLRELCYMHHAAHFSIGRSGGRRKLPPLRRGCSDCVLCACEDTGLGLEAFLCATVCLVKGRKRPCKLKSTAPRSASQETKLPQPPSFATSEALFCCWFQQPTTVSPRVRD